MAVIIDCLDKPGRCHVCPFGSRIDNYNTICNLVPYTGTVSDNEIEVPYWCPIHQYHPYDAISDDSLSV